jgi:Uma2 family endonuclease
MSTTAQAGREQRLVLHGVGWETYLGLREVPENYHLRMTYDQGDLEVMSPSSSHERIAALIGRLIEAWAEERGIRLVSCRTMTFRRDDLRQGLEPDNCYYIQNVAVASRPADIDLGRDPPPDLAVEVESTRSALGKLPLYAAFGVPEVWRYAKGDLAILRLGEDGGYRATETSLALPGFRAVEAVRLLSRLEDDDTTLVRAFREAIRR